MKLTIRFDIWNLIQEAFPHADANDEWFVEMSDVAVLPKKGLLTNIDWEVFLKDQEMVAYLNKHYQKVQTGEITELIYSENGNTVYIELEPINVKKRIRKCPFAELLPQ